MTLFHDINDYIFYFKCIKYCKEKFNFEIFAICLMTNHYHMLIKDVGKNLPLIMDTINSVYARYYNEKYKHKGSIFDGPFKSNPILDNYGFTRVYRYIIRNPVVAGITNSIYEYPWVTTIKEKDIYDLINYTYVDEVFRKVCKVGYEEYLNSDADDLWVDDIEVHRLEDDIAEEIYHKILLKLAKSTSFNTKEISKVVQKDIIHIAWFRGITLKQLSKFSGLSTTQIRHIRDK